MKNFFALFVLTTAAYSTATSSLSPTEDIPLVVTPSEYVLFSDKEKSIPNARLRQLKNAEDLYPPKKEAVHSVQPPHVKKQPHSTNHQRRTHHHQ